MTLPSGENVGLTSRPDPVVSRVIPCALVTDEVAGFQFAFQTKIAASMSAQKTPANGSSLRASERLGAGFVLASCGTTTGSSMAADVVSGEVISRLVAAACSFEEEPFARWPFPTSTFATN